MNSTTISPMLPKFRLTLEFSTEGYKNAWEAMGATLAASVQPTDSILNAEYIGKSANGWSMLFITFANVECARAFIFTYLGGDENTPELYADDIYAEVEDHIAQGITIN